MIRVRIRENKPNEQVYYGEILKFDTEKKTVSLLDNKGSLVIGLILTEPYLEVEAMK